MHNLDKSMLTLAAHTESADAFLIKVGALPKPQPCQAELSSRNSTGLYSRNGKWECYAGRVPRETLLALLRDVLGPVCRCAAGGSNR